jgi:hypothetical protein
MAVEWMVGVMGLPADPHRRLTMIVAYVITGVWSLSFLYDLFGPAEYEPNVALTPLMLTVATFTFGGGLLGKRKNGAGDE